MSQVYLSFTASQQVGNNGSIFDPERMSVSFFLNRVFHPLLVLDSTSLFFIRPLPRICFPLGISIFSICIKSFLQKTPSNASLKILTVNIYHISFAFNEKILFSLTLIFLFQAPVLKCKVNCMTSEYI